MAQRRGPVAGWSGTLAGLGIAGATLIATVGKKPASNLWFVLFVVVAVIGALIFILAGLPDVVVWASGGVRGMRQARRRAPRLVTDMWRYTSDGARAPAAMTATDLVLPGTGYMQQPGDRLPWVRFVILVPCSRIGSDADAQQLWLKFQQFLLKKQPVTSLVNGLTRSAPGLVWTRWATNWASVIDALLTSAEEDKAVAAARLELPDEMPRHGRDPRCALLILHFEPPRKGGIPMPPAGPVSWTDHMLRALQLPRAFASFLSGELGLTTPGEPPAVLGFRLEAQQDLAEMIDISGLQQLPGGRHRSQAIGYFVGDPEGQPAEDTVERMITDILRYGLGAERGPSVASPAGQRPEPPRGRRLTNAD